MIYETFENDRTHVASVRSSDLSTCGKFKLAAPSGRFGRLYGAASTIKWVGYAIAFASLFVVIAGGPPWILALALSTALIGSLGSLLAINLGPRRWLKGVRVRDLLTPAGPGVPYYTRVHDLIDKHRIEGADSCFLVKRDGHVLGLLLPEDIHAVDPRLRTGSAEHVMRSVDLVKEVNVDDDAADALELMRRGRLEFLPVTEGNRIVGIVRRRRILEAVGERAPELHVKRDSVENQLANRFDDCVCQQ